MKSEVKKVSYVISVHNGFETFKYTLPIILREFNREIAQLIIIDNASMDGLKDITSTFWDDSGVEYIRCNNKFKFGDALSKGIALAKGEWICYLGDDDLVNFRVFEMYQQHFESVESDIVVTDSVRFNWREGCEVADVLFKESQEKISIIDSGVARVQMLNKLSINAGGSFYIRKNIYTQILKKTGHFTPPQGAEFFIFRAALYLTKSVIFLKKPCFLHGRGLQGWGNTIDKKRKGNRWASNFEYEGAFLESTFWVNRLYTSISYDAAHRVAKAFDDFKSLDNRFWVRCFIAELLNPATEARTGVSSNNLITSYIIHVLRQHGLVDTFYAVAYIFYRSCLNYLIKFRPNQTIRHGYQHQYSHPDHRKKLTINELYLLMVNDKLNKRNH
jgi:glycosyltransferase involved in cell wall biosynthesis